jgi:hypothetical protein
LQDALRCDTPQPRPFLAQETPAMVVEGASLRSSTRPLRFHLAWAARGTIAELGA